MIHNKSSIVCGIFWEPDEEVKSYIKYWKKIISNYEPNAIYLNHPVHLTYFLLNIHRKDLSTLNKLLFKLVQNITQFPVRFSGWDYFRNDLGGKGDTLVYTIHANNIMSQLQLEIAKEISSLRNEDLKYDFHLNSDFLDSQKKWGFPFVGDHWKPHLTIALMKNSKFCEIELNNEKYNPSFTIAKSISLYQINNNIHQKLNEFYFV